jgi:hypothetical protein
MMDLLLQLRDPASPRAVEVLLDYDSTTSSQEFMISKINERLQESFASRLSPTVREYSAFYRDSGPSHFANREILSVKELMKENSDTHQARASRAYRHRCLLRPAHP